MAVRTAFLDGRETQGLLDWIIRKDGSEQFELASVGKDVSLNKLARDGVPLRWIGSQAPVLGLVGEATPEEASRVIRHGIAPNGKQIKTNIKATAGQERKVSISLVFAVVKTLSLLLISPDAGVREGAALVLYEEVQAAVSELEMLVTVRRGTGGTKSEHIRGLVGVYALHNTSSAGDPHLHVHVVFASSAPALGDGRWLALDSRIWFGVIRQAAGRFSATVTMALQRLLGFGVDALDERMVGSTAAYELKALLPLKDRYQLATAHMEDAEKALGEAIGGTWWREHELVWQRHRRDKALMHTEELERALDEALASSGDPAEAIRKEWHKRLGKQAKILDGIHVPATPGIPQLPRLRLDPQGMDDMLVLLAGERPYFIPPDVTALLASHGYDCETARRMAATILTYWYGTNQIKFPHWKETTPEQIIDAVADGSTDTNTWRRAMSSDGKIVTTVRYVAEEYLRRDIRVLATQTRQTLVIDLTGLSGEQAAAASLIAQGQALTAISGVAGAGKTTLLTPVVAAAKRAGMNIMLLARQAKLARELATELEVEAHTFDWYAHTIWTTSRPTLIILEEMGVIDRRHMLPLLVTAQSEYVQIVAIGDRFQNQPIDRLATWAIVEQEAANMDAAAYLSISYRTRAWSQEATYLRRCEHEAVDMPAKDNRVRSGDLEKLATDVMHALTDGEEVVALAADNETSGLISDEVQFALGVCIDQRTRIRWGQQCGVGDLVRTRLNDYLTNVLNGDTWQVTRITDGQIYLLHQGDGREATVYHDWAKEWLELGYALTCDAAQGVTVDRAFVLLDGMGCSRLYAAATRGRQPPIYYSTEEDAVEALEDALRYDDISETANEILTPEGSF